MERRNFADGAWTWRTEEGAKISETRFTDRSVYFRERPATAMPGNAAYEQLPFEYSYRIRVVDPQTGRPLGLPSEVVTLPSRPPGPERPTNLWAEAALSVTAGHDITLRWEAPSGTVTGYRIYRFRQPYPFNNANPEHTNPRLTLIHEMGAGSTSYTDPDVAGITELRTSYFYAVSALGGEHESPISERVKVERNLPSGVHIVIGITGPPTDIVDP